MAKAPVLGGLGLAVLLAVAGSEASQEGVKAVAGGILCVLVAIACVLAGLRLGVRNPLLATVIAVTSVPAALMITGFFLSLTRIGIRPESGGPCLAVIALAALFVASRSGENDSESTPDESHPDDISVRPAGGLLRGSGVAVALAAVGGVILVAGLLLSVHSVHNANDKEAFTSLSAYPAGDQSLRVEVMNHEGHSASYQLVLTGPNAATITTRSLQVSSLSTSSTVIALAGRSPVTISLYRSEQPNLVYRSLSFVAR